MIDSIALRKNNFFIFLALLALATTSASLSQTADSIGRAEDQLAFLSITAPQDSLPIFLDGKEIGVTPLGRVAIPIGQHQLVVRSPLWPAWDHPDYIIDFEAQAGQRYEFRAVFPVKVIVNSIPNQAKVYEGDKLLGTTPLIFTKMDSMDRTLRIEKTGYNPYSLHTSQLSEKAILIRLQPNEEWVAKVTAEQKSRAKKISLHRRLMFTSLGVAAIAGLATIHFRSRGNEEYSRYLSTAIPEEMDDHFDRAQYYDRMAGATYALFEMGFVMSGYFFLTSRP